MVTLSHFEVDVKDKVDLIPGVVKIFIYSIHNVTEKNKEGVKTVCGSLIMGKDTWKGFKSILDGKIRMDGEVIITEEFKNNG